MWQFDSYRLGSWLKDGLIIRAAEDNVIRPARAVSRKIFAGAVMVAAAISVADQVSGEPSRVGAVWTTVSIQQYELDLDGVMAKVNALDKVIEEKISRLGSLSMDDIDPELLALASNVIAKRKG